MLPDWLASGGLPMENYLLYRIAIWLVGRVPVGLAYFAAGVLAEVAFIFGVRWRRGVYANQCHVLPEQTGWFRRWRTARSAFRNAAYATVDFFRIPLVDHRNVSQFISEVRGYEHIAPCLAAGKGGIFVTVHMGSWELGGAYLGLQGVPLTAAALAHEDPRIDAIFRRYREETGMEVIAVGGALAKLEDAVRRGRFIGLLADRDTTGKGPLLPFFGQVTRMPNGHARLALATGAYLFPSHVYRRRNGKLVIDIRPPIIPNPEVDTIEGLTERCIGYLEEFIRSRPEQWFSFYDLWNTRELPVA